jgi:hypothetical protein
MGSNRDVSEQPTTPGVFTATTCVVPWSWWRNQQDQRQSFQRSQLDAAGEELSPVTFATREDLLDMLSAASGCTARQICEVAMLGDLPALVTPPRAAA